MPESTLISQLEEQYIADNSLDGYMSEMQASPTLLPFYPVRQSRLVGGQNAFPAQFPFQVSVRKYGSHICGGAIISANYVVTAAHCVLGM